MKTNYLLLIAGISSAMYAIILLFFPQEFLEMHGVKTDVNGILFARTTGSLAFGYALLGLFSGKIQSVEAIRLASITNFGAWTATFIVMMIAKTTLQFNSFIWADLAFCLLFSIAFGATILRLRNKN